MELNLENPNSNSYLRLPYISVLGYLKELCKCQLVVGLQRSLKISTNFLKLSVIFQWEFKLGNIENFQQSKIAQISV